MSETTAPVQIWQDDYKCDHCDIGFMRPTGIALMSSPPKYPHECNHCGSTQTFWVRYPSQRVVAK